ncbi:MAG: N-6 DNA methylase [Bacteroidales bacterium]|nr:N-6 DNA methylase [Bacteroidales bacterium]
MDDCTVILKKVVSILSEDRFVNVKGHKVSYDDYCKLRDYEREHKGDEDIVVTPILLEILKFFDYKSGINILQQVSQDGDKPDFRTTETNKFILDAKSTGTEIKNEGDSKSAVNQIKRYLESFKGYEYGILFNLHRFEFFIRTTENDLIRVRHLADRTINLVKLIHDFSGNIHGGTKDYENFTWFYNNFKFETIQPEEYIELIKNRHKEDLITPDKKFLKKLVYGLVDKIQENIRRQILPMSKDLNHHIQLRYELDKLSREINLSEGENRYLVATEELVKQISYVVLLRFILIRIFEDNNLIPPNLYNGGFKKKLEPPFSMTFKEILLDARVKAGELFSYFEDKFPYNFQITKDDNLLIQVLFELSKINFSEINFDLIGDLYEHYLNEDERKDKGQFYTPHYIVEFILNRVGFLGKIKDKPNNKTLFDPACGSGSFLVEAAIRLRKEGMNRETEAKRSIVDNLHGSEITGFASRLAELNLIIQILSLVKRIENDEERQTQSFRVCTTDSLMKLYNHDEFGETDKVAFDTSEFTSTYKDVFIHLIASKNDFDFVVGNPPYVGEKGHKELFRPLQSHSYWKHLYQGKSDYLYYFILLGLSKLAEGGKLGFITTQYWLTADGAGNLRNYILQHAKIIEIIDFKGIKLFPEAQGQENIVFILEKCSIESERTSNKIKIIQFFSEWANSDQKYINAQNQVITNYDRFIDLLTHPTQFELFADPDRSNFALGKDNRGEIADVYYSGTIQGELDENAWYLYSREKPVTLDGNFAFLTDLFNVNQGIVSGADQVTNQNIKKIPVTEQNDYNIKPGDPIFIFDLDQLETRHFSENELKYIKPFYKNSEIHRGFVDFNELQFVIYSDDIDNIEETPSLKNHFNRLGSLLRDRLVRYEEDYRWFNLHRGRNKNIFESEKLVTSRRAKENTFAYENKRTYPQSDITLITPKEETRENLKYLFALLNSDFLNSWYGKNTKMKGNMREFYFTPMSKIPIRKIDFESVDDLFVHDFLGGYYTSQEPKDPGYHFDDITQTYIRQKGLTDYFISLKHEIYSLKNIGFEFDPEKEVTNPDSIRVDLNKLADFLVVNHLAQIKFVRDAMLFYPSLIKDPTLYTFNSTEKTELQSLLSNCTYFIKTTTKDIHIKSVKADRIESLFNDAGDFGNYGFGCSIDFITNDNKVIEVECKTQEDAIYLADLVQAYLKKSKLASWETLMAFPVINEVMERFILEKKSVIVNALSPLNEKLISRLEQIFQNREIEPIAKINNINCLQYLINRYVDYLYKGI